MRVEMRKCDALSGIYGLPEHKVREITYKQDLIDAAELLLESCANTIVIVCRDAQGRPSFFSEGIGGQLANGLEFDYED